MWPGNLSLSLYLSILVYSKIRKLSANKHLVVTQTSFNKEEEFRDAEVEDISEEDEL